MVASLKGNNGCCPLRIFNTTIRCFSFEDLIVPLKDNQRQSPMSTLSSILPVLSIDERYFPNAMMFQMAPEFVQHCPFPSVQCCPPLSGRVPCVRQTRRAVCPRGSQRQKRSQSLDNGRLCRATQLSDADGSFSERVNRSPPCIENCIIWHLDSLQESVGHRTRGGCTTGGHSIPRCPDHTTVRQVSPPQTITKIGENMQPPTSQFQFNENLLQLIHPSWVVETWGASCRGDLSL